MIIGILLVITSLLKIQNPQEDDEYDKQYPHHWAGFFHALQKPLNQVVIILMLNHQKLSR